MGIFAYHIGKMDIPEEHREKWAQQMLELLRTGGMMTVETLQLYKKKIYLLSPPEFDEEGRATGYYNYFEKDCWEDWWLSTKRGDSQGAFSFGRECPLREPQRNTRAAPLTCHRRFLSIRYCTHCVKKCQTIFVSTRFDTLLAPLGRSCRGHRSQTVGHFLETKII